MHDNLIFALTFTCAALPDKPHHQRCALITFGGNSEGLHTKLMCLGLWSEKHQPCYNKPSRIDRKENMYYVRTDASQVISTIYHNLGLS